MFGCICRLTGRRQPRCVSSELTAMAGNSVAPRALLLAALLSATDFLSAEGASEDADFEPTYTVRTAVGETAFLACHLPIRGDQQVFWARQQIGNVLIMHPRDAFVVYNRLHASCSEQDDICLLLIRNVEKSDSGLYLCADDSEPPIRRSVYLSVLEPTARILGEPFRVHWQGSAINLTCEVQPRPGPGGDVVWKRGDSVIDPSQDSRLSIKTVVDASTVSHLQLADAQPKDSGRYTCLLASGVSDSVDVDVMQVVSDDFSPTFSGGQQPLHEASTVVLVGLSIAVIASTSRWC